MFIPEKVVTWFTSLKDSADLQAAVAEDALAFLKEELVTVRAERDMLRAQLLVNQTNFDWLRMRVNALEYERAVLLEAASGLKFSSPMIAKEAPPPSTPHFAEFNFDDVGDAIAKEIGLPLHNTKN